MLQNLDCFSDRLIPEKPCKHEVPLFMNLRRLVVTTGEWWLQTVQSSCTGAKKSAAQMHCDGGHHVFIQLSHPGSHILSGSFKLHDLGVTRKPLKSSGYYNVSKLANGWDNLLFGEKHLREEKHGSGTKFIIIWVLMPDMMDHTNAVQPLVEHMTSLCMCGGTGVHLQTILRLSGCFCNMFSYFTFECGVS